VVAFFNLRSGAWSVVLAAAIVFLTAIAPRADTKPSIDNLKTGPVEITAAPISSFLRFGSGDDVPLGKLKFRGGLVLTSEHKHFGGWSGLVLDDDARRFVAISDIGVWMTGEIDYDGDRPSRIKDARLGPLLGQDGSILTRNIYRDAEAVTLEKGTLDKGTLLVSFERRPRIVRYGIGDDGVEPAEGAIELPKRIRAMRRNQGFEAITVMKSGDYKGRTIAFAERLYNKDRNHTGWIWTKKGVEPLYLKNIGDFDVTDVASGDDGSLYVLERRFRWTEGVKMRLRRITRDELKPGRTVTGDTLVEADMAHQIDNMEGLSITRAKTGAVLVTMISDDNMNRNLQRTLLLQFTFNDTGEQRARLQD